MSYLKRMVCFANSLKTGGRCVAGRERLPSGYGGWVRPVSARPTAELSLAECRYGDGTWPKLLDILDVGLKKPLPDKHQMENHLVDSTYWVKRGELAWGEMEKLVEEPDSLWHNGERTYYGINDVVAQRLASELDGSLALIRPESVAIRVGKEGAAEFPRKTRALLSYRGVEYSLKVTDPVAEQAFQLRGDGEYPLDGVYLCVSLTEPYERDGRCYKIVAGVISPEAF